MASPFGVGEYHTMECQGLLDIFPHYTQQQVVSLLNVIGDIQLTTELLANGLASTSLMLLVRRRLHSMYPPNLTTTIYIKEGEELRCTLAYYKRMAYLSGDAEQLMGTPIEVCYGKEIDDGGGAKAQFFFKVVECMLTDLRMVMFETTQSEDFLPTVNQEALLGGLYETLGKVIVYSILYNCTGSPYLSKAEYLYMITLSIDETVPFITLKDLPLHAHSVLSKVCVRCSLLMLHVSNLHYIALPFHNSHISC